MKKRTKLILAVGAGVFVVVLVGCVFAWVLLRNKPVPIVKPTRVTFSVDGGIPKEQESKYTETLKQQLQSYGYEAEQIHSDGAEIIIGFPSGKIPISSESVGKPNKLEGPEFISASNQDKYFVEYNNLPSNFDQEKQQQLIEALKKVNTPTVTWTLNSTGDIIIGRTVYEQESRRVDFTSSFAKVKDLVANADYTVADAEWTAADGIPYHLQGLSFASPAKSLDGLSYAGIDAVSLANNHSMNGGVTAFEQMFNNLKARNIGYFGAGHNSTESHAPYIANIKGMKVAFLGYTAIPGGVEAGQDNTGVSFMKIAPWFSFSEVNVTQMEADIKAAKASVDVVIPFFHWSEEYTHQPNDEMRTVAHRAIDAGASMVIGSHPHWVQGIEWYNGHLINYSLGNFVFDQEQSLKTKQGVMLSTQWSGTNLVEAKYIPIQIEQYYQPHVLEGSAGQEVLNNIYTHSWWPNQ